MTEWQLIKSVPKDGRFVILYQEGINPYVTWWVSKPSSHPLEKIAPGWAHTVANGKPTHWLALPDLP